MGSNLPAPIVGQPVGEFFGLKSLGIYQSQAQIDALNAKAPGGIYRPGTVAHPAIVILQISRRRPGK
jgi:hypothetical protein